MLKRWLRTLRSAAVAATSPVEIETPPTADPNAYVVDSDTRTFWSRGAPASETLVEAAGEGSESRTIGRRVAALVAERDRPAEPEPGPRRRPVTDPAFSEALFVELMREGRYERAFALLAPDCQRSWGSAADFARQQDGIGPQLLGVDVRSVRRMHEWEDGGRRYEDVAELEVAYTVRAGTRTAVLPRTVHLIAVEGHWRSFCWPS